MLVHSNLSAFIIGFVCSFFLLPNSASGEENTSHKIKLVTLDPGHFHAALIQKTMYPHIDPEVKVFAPPGQDMNLHLQRIQQFNTRSQSPTSWELEIYQATDFLPQFLKKKQGDVVVLSGNNARKTEYIYQSIQAGYHVFADKPMAINSQQFKTLEKSIELARNQNRILMDMMTERFEITNRLLKRLAKDEVLFGQLLKGTKEEPAIVKESVHHFYKQVAGNTLVRPAWFFDEAQEGDSLVDVGTHLVDQVQWTLFNKHNVHYKDLKIHSAKRWPTIISLNDFYRVTQLKSLPDFLKKNSENDTLKVFANGEIHYQLRDIHARIKVNWEYLAKEGAGDSHYSLLRGSRCELIVRQGEQENYKPELYIASELAADKFENLLQQSIANLQEDYPGLSYKRAGKEWQLVIPAGLRTGHEEHFAKVTETLLEYLQANKPLPDWMWQHTLLRYYTTTQALEKAETLDNI